MANQRQAMEPPQKSRKLSERPGISVFNTSNPELGHAKFAHYQFYKGLVIKNVLGIDVGYGFTKWVSIDQAGETKRGSFRSIAPITTTHKERADGGMSALNVITVGVGQNNYCGRQGCIPRNTCEL
jgi:hypothetical protein